MLKKIKNTLENYLTANHEVMESKEIAELKAQIAFVEALDEASLTEQNKELKERIVKLQEYLFKFLDEKGTEDRKVTRGEFIDIYNEAVDYHFNDEEGDIRDVCPIYDHNITVHWHGIYCDCSDGAVASNIIDGVRAVISEDGDNI